MTTLHPSPHLPKLLLGGVARRVLPSFPQPLGGDGLQGLPRGHGPVADDQHPREAACSWPYSAQMRLHQNIGGSETQIAVLMDDYLGAGGEVLNGFACSRSHSAQMCLHRQQGGQTKTMQQMQYTATAVQIMSV